MPRFPAESRRPRALLALLLCSLLGGCAASQKGESAPQSAPAPAGEAVPGAAQPQSVSEEERAEPSTLEEAEAALRRAQAELDDALGRVAFASPPPPAAAPAPAAEPPARAAPSDARAEGAESRVSEGKKADAVSNCELACRAFTSLGRAAQAVCRLDGDGGERCGRARKVLSQAEARVSGCSCSRP